MHLCPHLLSSVTLGENHEDNFPLQDGDPIPNATFILGASTFTSTSCLCQFVFHPDLLPLPGMGDFASLS